MQAATDKAVNEGVTVTEWQMLRRLKRNQEMKEMMVAEWSRLQARKMMTPTQQRRGELLDAYLEQVCTIYIVVQNLNKQTVDSESICQYRILCAYVR